MTGELYCLGTLNQGLMTYHTTHAEPVRIHSIPNVRKVVKAPDGGFAALMGDRILYYRDNTSVSYDSIIGRIGDLAFDGDRLLTLQDGRLAAYHCPELKKSDISSVTPGTRLVQTDGAVYLLSGKSLWRYGNEEPVSVEYRIYCWQVGRYVLYSILILFVIFFALLQLAKMFSKRRLSHSLMDGSIYKEELDAYLKQLDSFWLLWPGYFKLLKNIENKDFIGRAKDECKVLNEERRVILERHYKGAKAITDTFLQLNALSDDEKTD